MTSTPCAVPLVEQLRSVPRDAVLRIDTPNALGCMDTRSIPVGRLCHEAAAALQQHPEPVAKDAMEAHAANGLAWAVSCWQAEVSRRPLVNVHRRTLDDTWRQVIRYFGGDPEKLIGPNHDTLHMRAQEERAWKP